MDNTTLSDSLDAVKVAAALPQWAAECAGRVLTQICPNYPWRDWQIGEAPTGRQVLALNDYQNNAGDLPDNIAARAARNLAGWVADQETARQDQAAWDAAYDRAYTAERAWQQARLAELAT